MMWNSLRRRIALRHHLLVEICSDVIAAGATTINIPDTVGYAIPFQTEKFFRELIGRTQGGDKVIWSAHCHDDLGLSVSNSLAAVMGGARQGNAPSMVWRARRQCQLGRNRDGFEKPANDVFGWKQA